MTRRFLLSGLLALALSCPPGTAGQPVPDDDLAAMASWIAVDAATGYENRGVDRLLSALPGFEQDRWGNLVLTVGSGAPRRVVACALDAPAYAVTQVTPGGYLRVHRIGGGSRHPLWDQAWEAQPVRILTRRGPVTGVVARSNGHFAAQHRDETDVVSADDLWIDVGAESAAAVGALGIELLDPVARHLPAWTLEGGQVAGPGAGRRVGCAAVATLARLAQDGGAPPGETSFVLSAQEVFGWVGLSSLLARSGGVDELVVLAPGEDERVTAAEAADASSGFRSVLEAAGVDEVTWLAPAVRWPGSHVETVEGAEAREVLRLAAEAAETALPVSVDWVAAPPPAEPLTSTLDPAHARVARLLERLVETHGVPGREWAVRRAVLEAMPMWARERAEVDDVGNVTVAVGPDADTTVFMAHMDEVGFEIVEVAADGVVTLDALGGAVRSAWEGQTALAHVTPSGAPSTLTGTGEEVGDRWKQQSLEATAPPPLRGVFLSRDDPDEKDPRPVRAWFGVDSAGLAERGVGVGTGVTSHKDGLRLGPRRFVARALDDRAGTTALVLALHEVDPDALPSKVIFAFSVHEEGGLEGAEIMAKRFGVGVRRIYSVDTFVSSDTPLESPHFAFTPLGGGPVLRAIENRGISPDAERDRVRRVAAEAGIPLQIGLTQGGTDGSRFTFRGAPNQGLSWPGRYSHSPGEVLDLADLARLRDLVIAMARTGG